MNVPGKERVGYVGLPQAGVVQRFAEDGELQIKSPGMMMGYYKNKMATDEIFSKTFYNLVWLSPLLSLSLKCLFENHSI